MMSFNANASVDTVYFAFSGVELPETIFGFAFHHFGNSSENLRNTPGMRGLGSGK